MVTDRINIAFFGCRNAGKSSLVNAVCNQEVSVVSDVKGTTTDPIKKTMELLPLGPVVIIDTPGYDDEGSLGELRVKRTKRILNITDIAVIVIDSDKGICRMDAEVMDIFEEKKIPYITVFNKMDLCNDKNFDKTKEKLKTKYKNLEDVISISTQTDNGINNRINDLKDMIASVDINNKPKTLVSDLIKKGDTVIMVVPIDSAAPKGRLILPQQMVLRDILDTEADVLVCRETELSKTFEKLKNPPELVITDSQVFGKVANIISSDVPLTSFSIIMARYKGLLKSAINGVSLLDKLKDGDVILISEGCTHHRSCEDIGTVKIPNLIKKYINKDLKFEVSSGNDFPEDLKKYSLIIHCGGCMITEKEMMFRIKTADDEGVPITNYGTVLAKLNGILERSLKPFENKI